MARAQDTVGREGNEQGNRGERLKWTFRVIIKAGQNLVKRSYHSRFNLGGDLEHFLKEQKERNRE